MLRLPWARSSSLARRRIQSACMPTSAASAAKVPLPPAPITPRTPSNWHDPPKAAPGRSSSAGAGGGLMPETTPTLHVRITTARGDVFSDWVDGAEIRTADGSIRLVPNQHAYLSFDGASRLCLRRGADFVFFQSAQLRGPRCPPASSHRRRGGSAKRPRTPSRQAGRLHHLNRCWPTRVFSPNRTLLKNRNHTSVSRELRCESQQPRIKRNDKQTTQP